MKRRKLLDKYYDDFFNGSIIAIGIGIFMLVGAIFFLISDGKMTILTGIILFFGIIDIVGGLLRLRFLKQYAEKFRDLF